MLHRVLRSTDPVNTLGLTEELGAFRNMDLPGQVDEGMTLLAAKTKQAVRAAVTDPKLIRTGAAVGAIGGGVLGMLLASPMSARIRSRRAEDQARQAMQLYHAYHAPAQEPLEQRPDPFDRAKISAGMLSRMFSRNRGLIAGGARPEEVTRRQFLRRMGRGAVANSPLGHMSEVPWNKVEDGVARAVAPVAARNVQMTRRQALKTLPVAGAVQGKAVLDIANALTPPSLAKSMVRGAVQAVNPVKPDVIAARTVGLGGLRRKVRAVNAAKNLIEHPTQQTKEMATRVAIGAPKMTAAALRSVITAA